VTDDLLARLDRDLDRTSKEGPRRVARPARPNAVVVAPPQAGSKASFRDRVPWLEIFITVQFLWGALLFLPGSQAYRPIVRALPYSAGVALLVIYFPKMMKTRSPRGTITLLLALALLVVNLLHPTSQLGSGVAQCVFQAAIAAPMFWGWKSVFNVERLRRLLWLALLLNTLGAVLGVLQVYYPDRFMPPQFSSLGTRLNELYVESLTYVGSDGQRIVRPPGLSDQPGGAAVTGALAVVLGAGLSLGARTPTAMVVTLGSIAVGLAAIYLTQVRALLLMSVGTLAVLAALLFRRGQVRLAARISITAVLFVIGSFIWARSLGGDSVSERFVGITRQGALQTYQENRGGFVAQTFGELLDEYPLGAGVGRWGMMYVYFGDPDNLESAPIHVEIQPTGWLLDGGLPMWALYGGALCLALLASYRLSIQKAAPELADIALIVLAVQVLVVGFGWAGPVFNTQLGLLFWFLTSALHGAALGTEVVPGRHGAFASSPVR